MRTTALSWPWNELGVSYCTELESLVFYISISTRSEYQPYSWRHLVVLHDISAPLQKIHIRFQIVGDPEDIPTALASVNWEQLDRLLSRYHQTLERVDFEMSYERMKAHQLQRECEIVRNSLPQLVSLGCLHFV